MIIPSDQQQYNRRYAMLLEILESRTLHPHFQPIVDLQKNELIGHEALIRGPAGTEMASPSALFQTAIENNLLHQLELLCRTCSLERFSELNPGGKLFLNISASLLGTKEHTEGFTAELLDELGLSISDIVIELSEQHPFDQQGLSSRAVEHYRSMGFQVAVDDLGTGYSGLKLWSELKPEYVKIDRHFVSNIDQDPVKREFVRSIYNISRTMNCKVIAEGIERVEEARVIRELGITLGQGFFIGYPSPEPCYQWQPVILPERRESNEKVSFKENVTAASLLRNMPSISMDESLGAVSDLFRLHGDYSAIAIVEDAIPLGVVRKETILELFSTQYGRALYEKKPASKILCREVLIVESDLSLEEVSRQVTDGNQAHLQQDFIITQEGCYLGMGSVRDLLKQITELKIQNAQYANPLTLLPGNVPINEKVDRLLTKTVDFHVAYFDLNNFKPFNDCYGYARGDEVIRLLGTLLTKLIPARHDFIGHIGGDDFVVLFRSMDWHLQCERVIHEFDQQVRALYSPKDLQQEGIWGLDRNGEKKFYPLLGLAIGVVNPDPYRCSSHHEVAELAAMAKKEAKKSDHSSIFISRRRSSNLVNEGDNPEKRQAV